VGSRMTKRLSKIKLVALIVVSLLIFPVMLFLPAGTLIWPEAWLVSIFFGIYIVAITLWLNKNNPDLLRERLLSKGTTKGWKGWDKFLMIALSVPGLLLFPIAAFDAVRYQLSQVPLILKSLCFVGIIPFLVIAFLVMRENTYATKIVRLQREREQKVVTTGPYSYVRHPMYAGAILFFLCLPLALGSYYATIPGILVSIIIIIRTHLEDKTLKRELKGYKEYIRKVKYRLIPGIW
jgi:protein-S-isoprenylcysteine O-methyltransferase Ste14